MKEYKVSIGVIVEADSEDEVMEILDCVLGGSVLYQYSVDMLREAG